jgi:hypothetical protein
MITPLTGSFLSDLGFAMMLGGLCYAIGMVWHAIHTMKHDVKDTPRIKTIHGLTSMAHGKKPSSNFSLFVLLTGIIAAVVYSAYSYYVRLNLEGTLSALTVNKVILILVALGVVILGIVVVIALVEAVVHAHKTDTTHEVHKTVAKRLSHHANKKHVKHTVVATMLMIVASMVTGLVPDVSKANVISLTPGEQPQQASEGAITSDQQAKILKIQLPWVANTGGVGDSQQYPFYSQTSAGTVYAGPDGITYSLPTGIRICTDAEMTGQDTTPIDPREKPCTPPGEGVVTGMVLREQFVGGKSNRLSATEKSETTVSRFIGNDPEKWESNLDTYKDLKFSRVWPGISVTVRAYQKNVEKIFRVMPWAHPDTIQVAVDGADTLSVNESGQLVVGTPAGDILMTAPVAFQYESGEKVFVDATYTVDSTTKTYGFEVPKYDRTKALYIDPLLASTYVGGTSASDVARSMALDSSGNVYLFGFTSSASPTGVGTYDTTVDGTDAVIHKLDNTLSSLLASTFIGGAASDAGYGIAIDGSDNIYVVGSGQAGFPTTGGAYDTTIGGTTDVFVSKLPSSLTTLTASTFIGGANVDLGYAIALDASNNVYITGQAQTGFPTTGGAYDTTHNGTNDAFVSILPSGLASLTASTFIGGTASDIGYAIALDSSNNVYVTGEASTAFPTVGAYDSSLSGGTDVFISKLPSTLATLTASTYIGGTTANDIGHGIVLDSSNNVYVTGYAGTGFPSTAGAYDTTLNTIADAFVSKLPSTLASLTASTFLGGSTSSDRAYGIALDSSENDISGTVYTDEGVTNIGAGKTVNVLVNGVTVGNDDTDASGNYSVTGVVADGDIVTVFIDGETEDGVTFAMNDGANMTGLNIYQDHAMVLDADDTLTMANINTGNDGDADIITIITDAASGVIQVARNSTSVQQLHSHLEQHSIPMVSIEIISGATLNAAANAVNVADNFINSGTFTHTAGTDLTFDGGDAQTFNPGSGAIGSDVVVSGAGTIVALSTNALNIGTNDITIDNATGVLSLAGMNLTADVLANTGTLRLRGSETVTLTTQDTDSGTWEYIGDGDTAADTFTIKDFGATDYYQSDYC